jgi:hypothetical protein
MCWPSRRAIDKAAALRDADPVTRAPLINRAAEVGSSRFTDPTEID